MRKNIVEVGEILFANLKLSGQDNSLYYFDKEGSEGHYDKNGKSVKGVDENSNKWSKTFITIWHEKTSNRWI